jgi:hypothetical protein
MTDLPVFGQWLLTRQRSRWRPPAGIGRTVTLTWPKVDAAVPGRSTFDIEPAAFVDVEAGVVALP